MKEKSNLSLWIIQWNIYFFFHKSFKTDTFWSIFLIHLFSISRQLVYLLSVKVFIPFVSSVIWNRRKICKKVDYTILKLQLQVIHPSESDKYSSKKKNIVLLHPWIFRIFYSNKCYRTINIKSCVIYSIKCVVHICLTSTRQRK